MKSDLILGILSLAVGAWLMGLMLLRPDAFGIIMACVNFYIAHYNLQQVWRVLK